MDRREIFLGATILAIILLFTRRVQAVGTSSSSTENTGTRYTTGEFGQRSEVSHPVKWWSDDDYTTSTEIDEFVQRVKSEALGKWKYGSRTGGYTSPLIREGFERASIAYKWGSYFKDRGEYLATVMYMIFEPTGKGAMHAYYAVNGMPMPEMI